MNFFLFCFIFFLSWLQAADIGSDTAVTRFNTQQILQNGDRIAGFAALAGGFAMANSSASGTFDCFFPVEGNVSLNFGTLNLSQDLIFNAVSSITTLGVIQGNGHMLELASSMNAIPSDPNAADCGISFLTNFNADDTINSVDWNSSSNYVAIGKNTGAANELEVFSWNGSSLSSVAGVAFTQNVNSVNWHPTNSWIAAGRVAGAGNEIYNYSFTPPSTLTLLSSIAFASTINEVSWRPAGGHLALATAASVAVSVVSGGGVISAPVAGATVALASSVNTVDWNSGGTFLVVGTSVNAGLNELRVYSFNTVGPALTLDASFDVANTINSVSWNKVSPNTSIIAVGTNAPIAPATSSLRLFSHSTGVLTEIPTTIGLTTQVNSVDWRLDGGCLVVGTNVVATAGAPGEIQTYAFSNNVLSSGSSIDLGITINSVRWSRNGSYVASGGATSTAELSIFRFDSSFINMTSVLFNDIQMYMNSNITLQDVSITFSGQSSITGRGNTLTLAPTFTLLVKEGGSLLLKDMTITGVNDSKIRALSSSSTFSFQDVNLVLDGDFTFSLGRLDILKNLKISGPNHAFIYTSDTQSIIRGGRFGTDDCAPMYSGVLTIDTDTTFSYRPASSSSTLLNLESSVSKIILNSGTLAASILSLTKGILQIDGKSTLNASTSITLGDGTAANNLCIEMMPAANLEVMGSLIYNNV